jgi:hypothetical protein
LIFASVSYPTWQIDPMTSYFQAVSFVAGHSWLDYNQLKWTICNVFYREFHTKHVADVQKLAEAGDLFIV